MKIPQAEGPLLTSLRRAFVVLTESRICAGHWTTLVDTKEKCEVLRDAFEHFFGVKAIPSVSYAGKPHMKINTPSSKVIANIASIIQANPPPPLQRFTDAETESSDGSPPALPKRNTTRVGPPLKPKPEELRPRSEPSIPKCTLQCPVCLTIMESTSLQTNGNVLAHLSILERLGGNMKNLASPVPAERVSLKKQPDEGAIDVPGSSNNEEDNDKRNSFVPENFWCFTCAKPCLEDCANHQHQSLKEYVERATSNLSDTLNGVHKRLAEQKKNHEKTDEAFKVVFRALNKASRHLWKRGENSKGINESLLALKACLLREEASTPQRALDLTAKVQNLRELDETLSSLENGTDSEEIYVFHQNNKLFISTREPDQTIVITINDSSESVDEK
ncbi:uncharacterized protein LOC135203225 isoform X2 [Macrobrachium nipponense]|uniref:uncharacterized protein LOC135203225 isoform X2 n=1 Tax=Macrobrachium nipponense TaxID=159736 RepID=UPI0030C850EB